MLFARPELEAHLHEKRRRQAAALAALQAPLPL
jgi:hypothetical protein